MCLGLHGPKVQCSDCGTPGPCLVADIYDWMQLRANIVSLYRSDLNDGHGHDLAIERTTAACGISPRFVLKTLRAMKVLQ
jgi:hypothetical protein